MDIKGYSIWKPQILYQGSVDADRSENALIIFLREFPELASEFYSGNEFWIRAEEIHLKFLETLILKRLQVANANDDWRTRFTEEQIQFLKRGERIVQFDFLGKSYEINTFGSSGNRVTMGLVSFYEMLVDSKDGLGLKVTPETDSSKNGF